MGRNTDMSEGISHTIEVIHDMWFEEVRYIPQTEKGFRTLVSLLYKCYEELDKTRMYYKDVMKR